MFYMITAEHMTRNKIDQLAQIVERDNWGFVVNGGMDAVFTGFGNLFVEVESYADALQIVDIAHSLNNGASCTAKALTDEEVDEYM